MVDHKARFLEAEEQATQLVNQLSSLKREIDAQSEATTSINELRTVLSNLASELTKASIEMQGIISKLVEIGGPAILETLDEIRTGVAQSLNNVQTSSNEIRSALSYLKNSIDESSSKIGSGVSAAREEAKHDLFNSRSEFNQRITRLERFVWITMGIGVVGVILLIYIAFLST